MSEDDGGPPNDPPGADPRDVGPPLPPYDPDHELIGYLEEREGETRTVRRRS